MMYQHFLVQLQKRQPGVSLQGQKVDAGGAELIDLEGVQQMVQQMVQKLVSVLLTAGLKAAVDSHPLQRW